MLITIIEEIAIDATVIKVITITNVVVFLMLFGSFVNLGSKPGIDNSNFSANKTMMSR